MMLLATSWLVVLLLTGAVSGSRLLLYPFDHTSHVKLFSVVGKHLQQAGHDVYLLTINKHKLTVKQAGIKHILLESKGNKSYIDTSDIKLEEFEKAFFPAFTGYSFVGGSTLNQTAEILLTKEIITKLETLKFDLAITEGTSLVSCMLLIPYKLNIPFITLSAVSEPWAVKVPSLPSLEPFHGFGIQPESGFVNRIHNVIITVAVNIVKSFLLLPLNNDAAVVHKYVPERPAITLDEIYMQAEMWIINLDIICLDWPRVSAPHYQFIGGVAMEPAQPLTADMEHVVNGASDGVVVITFGSRIKQVRMDIFQRMLAAFSEFPKLLFIMRHDGNLPKMIPQNVFLQKWLPQNDLLGHPNTKLFITHGGNNGQMEALYHGVPMIAFPFLGDQEYNSDRIVAHQFGKKLKPHEFTTPELMRTIQELLTNPVYTQNIKRCSAISKHLPSGASQLVMWVEHVLKFGGAHLKPPGLHLPMYQVLMLDVLAVLLLVLCAAVGLLYACCRCGCRVCCRRKHKTD